MRPQCATCASSSPPERAGAGYCCRLRRCLYGTRNAPQQWERFAAAALEALGFKRGRASAVCFYHPTRDILALVHGDDFVFCGMDPELEWIAKELAATILLKRVGKLGGDEKNGDVREVRCLNRAIRGLPGGLTMEADPRHAELLAAMLGPGGKPLSTPGVKEAGEAKGRVYEAGAAGPASAGDGAPGECERALSPERTGLFRAGAARANYLALDRPDVAFASKELCWRRSAPREVGLVALKRLARYLLGAPRYIYEFNMQEPADLSVYADTDWAGCAATRRSTSGGCALRGAHLVKHWSSTQKAITLSSGEAELAGVVKGSSEGLGLQSIALDLGRGLGLRVFTDSSAAQGICSRSGIGRVCHLAVGQLWVQERLGDNTFTLHKVWGEINPADLMTKHLDQSMIARHLGAMAVRAESGRAVSAPRLAAEVEAFLAGVSAPREPLASEAGPPAAAGLAPAGVGPALHSIARAMPVHSVMTGPVSDDLGEALAAGVAPARRHPAADGQPAHAPAGGDPPITEGNKVQATSSSPRLWLQSSSAVTSAAASEECAAMSNAILRQPHTGDCDETAIPGGCEGMGHSLIACIVHSLRTVGPVPIHVYGCASLDRETDYHGSSGSSE